MSDRSDLHIPAGLLADDVHDLALTPADAGWGYSGLHVVTLSGGQRHQLATGDREVVVLPLEGSFRVLAGDREIHLAGRASVFAGPTDFVYLGTGETAAVIAGAAGGRVALPSAIARRHLPVRYGPVEDVPVELRGAGHASRLIRNFCAADTFQADNLISVEVITPGGNWSSYPPHKHDELSEHETPLEEIYYFEVADGPAGPGPRKEGIAYQRVYGTADRPIDVLAEVRSGDTVLIPHGYHGPSMAAPGYDLYYLNVMAGPGEERAWRICNDPAHAGVAQTWEGVPIDPRLTVGGSDG
ncbi:MAG TPA: 5-deoxy-glucuronate isomerase [Euzebya sp.]|nr:5-deoxy-glucuronate isomerase [Euzebya sp.]